LNALLADTRRAVQCTVQRLRERCDDDRAISVFIAFINMLGRSFRPARKALRAALQKQRRRRIATAFDNPWRGLNLVPRIATIELKKDGPDLAGGDWG
jgi:hypothetical protein